MKLWKIPGGAVALLAMTAAAMPAMATPALQLRDAVAMAQGATEAAGRGGHAVSIVIVNREGRVILAQRMDGASYKSLDVAEGKATTAAALGLPTRLLQEALAKGDQSVLSVPGAIAIAGGVPVTVDGATIAAIGVSGGAPQDDEAIATAARDRYPGAKPR
ncbi:heme-binding protein [Rhizorhabdus wittichii]|uniref:Heme-binding protein n=1 Tax=Rhizorhabdus wittichii TaxID=160791 RepID=A0A975D1P2_9SPHN|nr:heme-binding protein [Rhizorhabdus wittichii]QTH21004.1 heme-binding protein [Rhizorhabdus wittichii]